jgi:hypothetical protein
VALQLGGWAWSLKILTVIIKLVTKDHKKPRTWTDLLDKRSKRKKMDMGFGTWKVRSMYRAGSLRAVAEEISGYKLDIVGVQEIKWDGGGTEPAGEYTYIFLQRGKGESRIGYGIFIHKRIISAVKGVEFVSDRMLYIILRGR